MLAITTSVIVTVIIKEGPNKMDLITSGEMFNHKLNKLSMEVLIMTKVSSKIIDYLPIF